MSAFPRVLSYQNSFLGSKFVVIGGSLCQKMRGNALFHKVLRALTKYLIKSFILIPTHVYLPIVIHREHEVELGLFLSKRKEAKPLRAKSRLRRLRSETPLRRQKNPQPLCYAVVIVGPAWSLSSVLSKAQNRPLATWQGALPPPAFCCFRLQARLTPRHNP